MAVSIRQAARRTTDAYFHAGAPMLQVKTHDLTVIIFHNTYQSMGK